MNSKKTNLEFERTFCQTNIFYMLGDKQADCEKIERMKTRISEIEKELQEINSHEKN